MLHKNKRNMLAGLILLIGGLWFAGSIASCGKQGNASPQGLNVQYEVLNLSPDLFPVNLYIEFKKVNTSPFIFSSNPGYFYLPTLDTIQIRTNSVSNTTLLSRQDVLKTGLKYSLFITGTIGDGSIKQIFTVDTASVPTVGRGKIRLVNASPTGAPGLDLYANGTQAFSKITYPNFSKFIEIPAGNYDFQINATGSAPILKDLPAVNIEDGRVYTIYAYGYTNRIDTAAFNAAIITNK